MSRLIQAFAITAAGAAFSTPAAAFQFENGTVWPLAVSINGGVAQVTDPEMVAFLFPGQCNNGCTVSIFIADPNRPQTAINGPDGEPPVILGNGDQVTLRVRQERSGLSVEVVGDAAFGTLPQQPATLPQQPGTLPTPPQLIAPPASAVQPLQPPAGSRPQVTPQASPGNNPPGFVLPPPAPEYQN